MKPVRFTQTADGEVRRAAAWYEEQSEGLGDKFLSRVRNPQGYAVAVENVRRCLAPRFQDALWFTVEPDESIVIACFHSRRSPVLAKERARGIIPLPKRDPGPR